MDGSIDILAFSPHPDDAELGCAGSLILASDMGLRVVIADVSEGELSSRGSPEQRKREKLRAGEIMGLSDRLSLGLMDTEIGADPGHRKAFIDVIRNTRPRIVLSPYWKDRHPDHAATGRLAREAFFYAGVSGAGQGSPFRPEQILYYMIHSPFQPSFVVDISPVWERKMSVLTAYESQFQYDGKGTQTVLSQPEFMRFINARAVWFGAMIGTAFGEPFLSPGPVGLHRLPGMNGFPRREKRGPAYCMYQ